jgi:4-hydroxybenzoyl-CoA reductase subunit beta
MRGRLFTPDRLISLRDLPELQQVERLSADGLAIGAGCRLTDLERHPALQAYPGLVAAIRSVASRHVRNMATLGGNLNLDTRCWYTNQAAEWREAKGPCLKTGKAFCHAIPGSEVCVAINASDIAPALIALDAIAVLGSAAGERRVPFADFYTDDGIEHTDRRPDEIMLRVELAAPAGRMVFIKETARKGNDFSYATIAARADGAGAQCQTVQMVLGSLTTRPVVLNRPAGILGKEGLGDEAVEAAAAAVRDELGVLTNLYTPAAYKSRLARTLVTEAARQLRVTEGVA